LLNIVVIVGFSSDGGGATKLSRDVEAGA